MQLFRESIVLLKYMGLWEPANCHGWHSWIYNLYAYINICNVGFFVIGQALDLVLISNNLEDFTNILFMSLTASVLCGKIQNIRRGRKLIDKLIRNFNEYPFKPESDDEVDIRNRYNRVNRINTLLYWGTNFVSSVFYGFRKIVELQPPCILPFLGWYPYDYTKPIAYWCTSVSQFHVLVLSASMIGAYDSFFSGMMMQICAQVKILQHRFHSKLDNLEEHDFINLNLSVQKNIENKIFSECIEHHDAILRMADVVNSFFSKIVFVQYSVSSVILVTSVYVISSYKLGSLEFTSCLMYLICMFYQIALLCTSGHATTLAFEELGDSIYNSNWLNLTNSQSQKNMIVMMSRMLKPFVITSGHIITLNMESLKYLMKLTYSIYNVL